MPLVRIDLQKGKPAAYREAAARIVNEGMRKVGVPLGDRFQIVGEHAAEDFIFDADYLGIHRTSDLVIIQITWNEGRTLDQKRTLYASIADGLAEELGIRKEDVLISLVEVKKENWSFGNGVAQYA